jgi:hypothetical protein
VSYAFFMRGGGRSWVVVVIMFHLTLQSSSQRALHAVRPKLRTLNKTVKGERPKPLSERPKPLYERPELPGETQRTTTKKVSWEMRSYPFPLQ